MRLGLAGYIVPFMFVYGPAMFVGQASWTETALALATGSIGTLALAGAVIGYLIRPATWAERGVLLVASLLLIRPGLVTDEVGLRGGGRPRGKGPPLPPAGGLLGVLVAQAFDLHPTGEHRGIHGKDVGPEVRIVEVPDDHGHDRQDGLPTVRHPRRGNEHAGDKAGEELGEPHDQAGGGHDRRPPDHRPVLELLPVVVAAEGRLLPPQPGQVGHVQEHVAEDREAEAHRAPLSTRGPSRDDGTDVIEGLQNQQDGKGAVDEAGGLDPAPQPEIGTAS